MEFNIGEQFLADTPDYTYGGAIVEVISIHEHSIYFVVVQECEESVRHGKANGATFEVRKVSNILKRFVPVNPAESEPIEPIERFNNFDSLFGGGNSGL